MESLECTSQADLDMLFKQFGLEGGYHLPKLADDCFCLLHLGILGVQLRSKLRRERGEDGKAGEGRGRGEGNKIRVRGEEGDGKEGKFEGRRRRTGWEKGEE